MPVLTGTLGHFDLLPAGAGSTGLGCWDQARLGPLRHFHDWRLFLLQTFPEPVAVFVAGLCTRWRMFTRALAVPGERSQRAGFA